jgi:hypothetical protein
VGLILNGGRGDRGQWQAGSLHSLFGEHGDQLFAGVLCQDFDQLLLIDLQHTSSNGWQQLAVSVAGTLAGRACAERRSLSVSVRSGPPPQAHTAWLGEGGGEGWEGDEGGTSRKGWKGWKGWLAEAEACGAGWGVLDVAVWRAQLRLSSRGHSAGGVTHTAPAIAPWRGHAWRRTP